MSVFRKGGELYPGKHYNHPLLVIDKVENHKRIAEAMRERKQYKQAEKHKKISERYLEFLTGVYVCLLRHKKQNRLPVYYGEQGTRLDRALLKDKQLYQIEQIGLYFKRDMGFKLGK